MDVMKILYVQILRAHLHVTSARTDFHVMKPNVHVSIDNVTTEYISDRGLTKY